MIYLAMDRVGVVESNAVVKIGDSQIDIEEGQNSKCGLTIGITTGAQTEAQLLEANPSHIIHGLNELLDLI